MADHNHNVNVNFNQPPPQRKLGCLGFLGVMLVIGAVIAQPLILGPIAGVVVLVVILAWSASRAQAQKGKQGGQS